MYKTQNQRVLGIDPGIANTGFAVVVKTSRGFQLVKSDLIKTSAKACIGDRLVRIYDKIREVTIEQNPDLIVIERVFHNRNITSSLKTAKSIAMVELAASQLGIPAIEITPQKAKAALNIGGSASKEQVQFVLNHLFKQKLDNHVADAAACAITGFSERRST